MEAPFVGNEGSGRVYICFAILILWKFPDLIGFLVPFALRCIPWISIFARGNAPPWDLKGSTAAWMGSMLGNLCKGKCCDTPIRLLAAIELVPDFIKVEKPLGGHPIFFSDLVLQYT